MRFQPVRPAALAALALCAATALTAVSATGAQAADLLEVWRAASQRDPQAAVAQAQREVGAARRGQAEALWRPHLGLSATAGVMSTDSRSSGAQFAAPGFGSATGVDFATSVRGGSSSRVALQARQPLWSPEKRAQSRQLALSGEAAELGWQAAQQDLMLATSERFFKLALTDAQLRLLTQQKKAVDQALAEARDRFAIGDKPVTDTHEASARALALQAQLMAVATEVELARQALADSTGLDLSALAPSRLPDAAMAASPGPTETPHPLAHWLALAAARNPGLRLQQLRIETAEQELARHSPQAGATLDLVAQASRDHLSGSGAYGPASNSANQAMLGLQLNLPLYTGGYRSARQDEALHQLAQARAELALAQQQVAQQTRAAWSGLRSGQARLAALAEAQTASNARRDATALGRSVGDRSTLDLLQAENDAHAAALAWLQARVDLTLQGLRLQALAGGLDEAQLGLVNAQMAPGAP